VRLSQPVDEADVAESEQRQRHDDGDDEVRPDVDWTRALPSAGRWTEAQREHRLIAAVLTESATDV